MFDNTTLNEKYPSLAKLAEPLRVASRPIVGREYEKSQLLAAMRRPELCNALLLAEPGSGKTALVQATMLDDIDRVYLEVDPARMIAEAGSSEQMAAELKSFFDEAERYVANEQHELVLFIDEFHQIIQLSDAAVEAIKPVLAASGARGIRVIAATTYEEFHQHISPNQPLVERLQRINLAQPGQATTVKILQGMADSYGVAEQFYDDHIFNLIYEYTQRYMPASSQPRKSILVLDAMVGWHRLTSRPMDRALLSDVLMESINVNVAFRVDAVKIKEQLDSKVLSQDFATSVVARRLQLCVADLNDKTKPLSSFLLTGSTGVGKATTCSTEIPVWTADGSVSWKKAGDLEPGDWIFSRAGYRQEVLGVFPQGLQDTYRLTLADGRSLDVSAGHLFEVLDRASDESWRVLTVRELLDLGLELSRVDASSGNETGRVEDASWCRFMLPTNHAVQWPETVLEVDPGELGRRCAVDDRAYAEPAVTRCLHGSISQRMGFLRGLVTAAAQRDGSAVDLGFESPRWERVGSLVRSLGSAAMEFADDMPPWLHMDTRVVAIEPLGQVEPMVCIYVADDEHLYQAGEFVVTHNTELTKQLSRLLFGDDQRHLIRFDMTEFASDESFAVFRSELTKRVWDRSHAVLLFDEIEKASPMNTRVLLQVLDDGRLSDDNNREVSFLNTYIVLTTNAGSEIYKTISQYEVDDTGSGKKLMEYEKLIRRSISSTAGDNRFPPELLGRIDAIVPFQPLPRATQRRIVLGKLGEMVREVMTKHNVRVDVDEKVLQYLIEDKADTESDAGGARAAVAKMTTEVTTEVAAFINANPSQRNIRVDIVGDLVSDHKTMLRSAAYVEVSAAK